MLDKMAAVAREPQDWFLPAMASPDGPSGLVCAGKLPGPQPCFKPASCANPSSLQPGNSFWLPPGTQPAPWLTLNLSSFPLSLLKKSLHSLSPKPPHSLPCSSSPLFLGFVFYFLFLLTFFFLWGFLGGVGFFFFWNPFFSLQELLSSGHCEVEPAAHLQ